jgi:hypothetical protein
LLLPTLSGLQFERRLSLLTTEPYPIREAANGMPRPLDETAVIAGLGSIIFELSLGAIVPRLGLSEFLLGPFECYPADHRARSFMELVLGDFPIVEELAPAFPEVLAQPVASFSFFLDPLNL